MYFLNFGQKPWPTNFFHFQISVQFQNSMTNSSNRINQLNHEKARLVGLCFLPDAVAAEGWKVPINTLSNGSP